MYMLPLLTMFFLFQTQYINAIGPNISNRKITIVVGIPYKVVQKKGRPCQYLIDIANTDQTAQTIDSIKIILSPNGIDLHVFVIFIIMVLRSNKNHYILKLLQIKLHKTTAFAKSLNTEKTS